MHMEITSVNNAKIKDIKALQTKKGRKEQNRFLAEGYKCVREGLNFLPGHIRLLLVDKDYLTEYTETIRDAQRLGAELIAVPRAILEAVSDVKTPQGIAAVFELPQMHIEQGASFLVALDSLQDPSNVGAIIRTADAAGADGVLLSPDCADLYAPKALRASMGSVFHIGTETASLAQALQKLKEEGFTICAAHLSGSEEYAFSPVEKICLVIGNEGSGISGEVMKLCDKRVRIPIYGKAESLNAAVAAGILLYDIARQRR